MAARQSLVNARLEKTFEQSIDRGSYAERHSKCIAYEKFDPGKKKRESEYAAYIGTEGYLIACELREGKQHCQKGTPGFLVEVPGLARQSTDKPLLIRLDSGNDSADNIGIFMEECLRVNKVHFIIRRNIRREQPQAWLDKVRDVCTNIKEPREGKKEYIGQASLGISGIPMKRPVKRRRLRTVAERIIMAPGVVTRHARQVRLDPGRSNAANFRGISFK